MVKIEIDSEILVEGLRLWVGYGSSAFPNRNDTRIIEKYGEYSGGEILRCIKSLEDDFYSCNAHMIAGDLHEMSELTVLAFHEKHPALHDEIANIFAWCYTYDYK